MLTEESTHDLCVLLTACIDALCLDKLSDMPHLGIAAARQIVQLLPS
jgi:hypothetical protein